MTTDPDEGRRQIAAMQPPRLELGDLVRLKAGGSRTMTVVELRDYDNNAVCEWQEYEGALAQARRETFPIRALVKVAGDERKQVGQGPESPRQRQEEGHAEQGDAVEAPTQG